MSLLSLILAAILVTHTIAFSPSVYDYYDFVDIPRSQGQGLDSGAGQGFETGVGQFETGVGQFESGVGGFESRSKGKGFESGAGQSFETGVRSFESQEATLTDLTPAGAIQSRRYQPRPVFKQRPRLTRTPIRTGPGLTGKDRLQVARYRERPQFEEKRPHFEEERPHFEEKRPHFEERSPYFEEKRPNFEERSPYFEEKRPNFEDRPHFEAENYRERPHFEEKRPNFEERPHFEERPNFEEKRPNFEARPQFEAENYRERPHFEERPQYERERPQFEEKRPNFEEKRPHFEEKRPNFEEKRPNFEEKRPNFEKRPHFEEEIYEDTEEIPVYEIYEGDIGQYKEAPVQYKEAQYEEDSGPKKRQAHHGVGHEGDHFDAAGKEFAADAAAVEHGKKDGRLAFQIHGQQGPHSYRFGYDTGKGYNRQFRYEERDAYGQVHGRYGFYDKDGKLQIVNYSAHPDHGFSADVPH